MIEQKQNYQTKNIFRDNKIRQRQTRQYDYKKKLFWKKINHDCEKYDKKNKIIRYFKCQKSKHIITQCRIFYLICAQCAKPHDIRDYEKKQ